MANSLNKEPKPPKIQELFEHLETRNEALCDELFMTWNERQDGGFSRHGVNTLSVISDNSSEQSFMRARDLVPRVFERGWRPRLQR